MNSLRPEIAHQIDGFFEDIRAGERNEMELGECVRELTSPDVMSELLGEAERDPASAVDADYSFNIGFDRITFNMGTKKGSSAPWRLRAHLFDPEVVDELGLLPVNAFGPHNNETYDANAVYYQEPWHFHKWTLGSHVLHGMMRSGYCFVTDTEGKSMPLRERRATGLPVLSIPQPEPNTADLETAIPMYYYHEAGARDQVIPELVGRCLLTKAFTHVVPRGSAYTQSIDLAHGVQLSRQEGPVVTAALMGPAIYRAGVFLEDTPQFPSRPGPRPFELDEVAALAARMKALIQTPVGQIEPATTSPWPDFLAVHQAQQ